MQEKEKRIQRLFDRFNGGTITLEDYIDAIINWFIVYISFTLLVSCFTCTYF